jgi:hypothetical protein
MKKLLLLSLVLAIGFGAFAQKAHLKPGILSKKGNITQPVSVDPDSPLKSVPVVQSKPASNKGDNPTITTVLTLGTAVNPYTYAANVGGDQKTMVWADDSLKAIVNVHRLGPGTTPPGLAGYLGVDLGVNMGKTAGDWTNQRQIYASTWLGGTYYVDAGRYPQGGIYNPPGNTNLANAYVAYFAPNLSNYWTTSGTSSWGGYSYGVDNLVDQADSTKHLQWYAPPPYNYIPDGFTIAHGGISFSTDFDQDWSSGALNYQNNIILNRGVWNSTTHDFEYTQSTIPCPVANGLARPRTERVAASPDGQTIWIACIGNDGNIASVADSAQYYPIFYKSTDAGLTWSSAIDVQLDGPNGLPGITDYMLSDYRITQLFSPPYPARTEIPYATAWDCDLAVDQWGNPHMGVIICVPGNLAFSVLLPASAGGIDSTRYVYDIYSNDGGIHWFAQKMGATVEFEGTWGTTANPVNEYNRTNVATNETGNKMFFTWNDTPNPVNAGNLQPDVFARGFDLLTNMITSVAGADNPNNVTFFSDISMEAYWECTSHYTFTDNTSSPTKYIIPIVTCLPDDIQDMTKPITFKYIADFSYKDADFTIPSVNPGFVGIDESRKNLASVSSNFPNPFKGTTSVTVNLTNGGNLSLEVSNLLGQKLMTLDKGNVNAGQYQFTIDGSKLTSGVYFYTVKVNDQSFTNKMIVE